MSPPDGWWMFCAEADTAPGPRSKVSLSAAFGRASAGIAEEGRALERAAPAKAAKMHKDKVRRVLENADHIEVHSGLRIK